MYNRANFEAINSELACFSNTFFTGFLLRNVNENWLLFKNKLTELARKYIPSISIKTSNTAPWFNRGLKALRNKRKRLFSRAKKCDLPSAWQAYDTCAKQFKEDFRSSQKKYYKTDLPALLLSNPMKFWNSINPEHSDESSLTIR